MICCRNSLPSNTTITKEAQQTASTKADILTSGERQQPPEFDIKGIGKATTGLLANTGLMATTTTMATTRSLSGATGFLRMKTAESTTSGKNTGRLRYMNGPYLYAIFLLYVSVDTTRQHDQIEKLLVHLSDDNNSESRNNVMIPRWYLHDLHSQLKETVEEKTRVSA